MPSRPLAGRKVLVTRTRQQSSKLSALLRAAGAEALEIPLLRIERNTSPELWESIASALPSVQWLVFTSENGVRAFFSGLRDLKIDLRSLAHIRIASIGSATSVCLYEYGLNADLQPEEYSATHLAESLIQQIHPGDSVMLARAAIAEEELPQILRSVGASVLDLPLYQTLPDTLGQQILPEILAEGEIDWIPFASSSAVNFFLQALGQNVSIPEHTRIACIGPSTAATARRLGLTVHTVAESATLASLVASLC